MLAIKAVIAVLVNLIVYFLFGTLFFNKKDEHVSVMLTMGVGFFAYFSLFCVFVLPTMFTYRTLSMLTLIWGIFIAIVCIGAILLKRKLIARMLKELGDYFRKNRILSAAIVLLILAQTVLIVKSYDFTLDAAYYVANASTSIDTNMINIYDPFTGAWQDHFELRYAFATYSINDAFLSKIYALPALVTTKTVMAATISILSNLMYLGIAKQLFKGDGKKMTIMLFVVVYINYTFITLYTASNFLLTRTYEGKAVLGNVVVPLIFWMFLILVDENRLKLYWAIVFVIAFGATTISSSANMLVPAQLTILFLPYIVINKKWKMLPGYLLSLMPGVAMMMIYVLYVKGFYAIHTYFRR